MDATHNNFLALVYQIDAGFARLLGLGQVRTQQSFEEFYALIGEPLVGKI